MPDSFDELDKAMQIVNKKEGVPGFSIENHWGWVFIPFLQGFGGNVFRNPPDDLMPTSMTPTRPRLTGTMPTSSPAPCSR